MSKYCNRCKRDLEIDNFHYYKKSICKECVNKKVKCDYCNKEFNSTKLSKQIKQIHSTLLRSDKSDSTLQRSDKMIVLYKDLIKVIVLYKDLIKLTNLYIQQ